AQRAGLDTMTVSRLESGQKKRLELETAARLARVFETSLDQLCGLAATPVEPPSLSGAPPSTAPDPALERFIQWHSTTEEINAFDAQLLHWHEQEGMSLKAIARRLNAAGVPTRSGRGQWYQASVVEILRHSDIPKGKQARQALLVHYDPERHAA